MSEYVDGTIIEFEKRKYAILKNIERRNTEHLVVVPVKEGQKKWEELKSIEELNADYDKLMVITHNKENDEYKFEKDKDMLTEVFTEMINNIKIGDK